MKCHPREEGVQMTFPPGGRPRGGDTRIPGRHPLRPHEGGTTTTLPHEGDETIRPREGGRAGTSRHGIYKKGHRTSVESTIIISS
jgi:hypothetical protein